VVLLFIKVVKIFLFRHNLNLNIIHHLNKKKCKEIFIFIFPSKSVKKVEKANIHIEIGDHMETWNRET